MGCNCGGRSSASYSGSAVKYRVYYPQGGHTEYWDIAHAQAALKALDGGRMETINAVTGQPQKA